MENTALKNLLTSLCANSPWKYAVFWNLKHMHQTLLTWEDGYCDYTKRKKSLKGKPDPACSSEYSKILSFGDQPGVSDRSSMDFSIGFAIGYMSCLQYALGEGVIGRAALTGDDKWVSFQNFVSGGFCSPKPEFPEEWNLQVTAGIETILLVPLLPHGVLQLGSFDKVDENLSMVSEIKDKFNSSLYKGNPLQHALPDNVICSSSMGPILLMNRDEANSWCTKLPSDLQFEYSEVISTEKVVHAHLSNYGEPISPSAVRNTPQAIESNLPLVLEYSCESDLSNSSFDPLNLPDPVGRHTNTDAQETICDFLTFSYMDDTDEVMHCSLLYGENGDDVGLSGDTSDGNANLYLPEDVLKEPMSVSDDIYTSPTTVAGTFFGFPVDCELLRGFETCFPEENDHTSSWDLCEPNYYGRVSPTYLYSNEDLISMFDPSPWEYTGYFDGGNHEDNLEGVVPSIYEQSDDLNSCTILSSVSSITSLAKNAASPTLSLSEEAAEEPAPPTHGLMSFFIGADDFHHSITPTPSAKSGISMLTEQRKRKKHSHGPSEKGVKQIAVSKKVRTNNGHKSRPKDRQLIQDRLKELRDIVPKGEKCSIDSLLDKAIKHMQFLTNVTEQAEKLRYSGDKEILAGEKLIEANNPQKGASSALQDLKLCPVTVKDLPRPGSMLIEMVCNEEELFFEITKVLSHLGLTILNSIMETNSGNNTSAKFIVEAPRGFSKMEIFFPLMQLLQRRRNTTTPVVI